MSWIETLTKEAFHSAIREAMKPQIDQISDRMQSFEQRISRLEGVVEGSMKANEANIRAYEATIFKSDDTPVMFFGSMLPPSKKGGLFYR